MSANARAANAIAAGNGAQAAEPQQKSFFQQALRYVAMWFALTTLSSIVMSPGSPVSKWIGKYTPGPSSGDTSAEVPVPSTKQVQNQKGALATALWQANDIMTMTVFIRTEAKDGQWSLPSHVFSPVRYGDWTWSETWETSFKVPKSVQNNGSLYAEIYLTRNAAPIDPKNPSYNVNNVIHTRKLLSRYGLQRRIRAEKNLLSGSANETTVVEEQPEDVSELPIISYYHPNLTLTIVNEPNAIVPWAGLPPQISQFLLLSPELPDAEDPLKRKYYPTIFPKDFWLLKEHMNPINETVEQLSLRIDFQPISSTKFQMFASLDASFSEAASKGGGGEMDEVKRMLTETSPFLLVTTALVTVLHMLFEFLAFSSDISHWRKKKEMVGTSVRTILTNCFVQLVVLLYLLDNNENTSWMILASQGIGLVIEAWKITKAVDIKLVQSEGFLPYKIEIHDKHVLSEDEIKTQEYDRLAFRIVGWITIPLLGGYTIYSLMYQTHRGWYSFVISTLTSFVYMFGFVQLIPQLIINYKLKSVAHLPMKALIYKTLTTVVDDFFAFCIRMPIMYRIAAFRDDVVFVILLYQYYIYRVDYTRSNEYGQVVTEEEKARIESKQNLKLKKTE